jgi:hypothetical protein
VQKALDENSALTSLIDAEVGYSSLVYEVSISDVDGTVMTSSDASLLGQAIPAEDEPCATRFQQLHQPA